MIRRVALLGIVLTRIASAQSASTSSPAIGGAVLPLPEQFRAGATVVRLDASFRADTLRRGLNGLVCIADAPGDDQFDVRCYRDSFIPVVYRTFHFNRADFEKLAAEIKSGTFKLSSDATAGYRCLGPISGYDASRGRVNSEIECWQSVHFPFRTASEVGFPDERDVPESRQREVPYVMASGTLWSHVMIRHPERR